MSEKLFEFDKDWHNNACLNYTNDAMYSYIKGYKKAGDLLVEAAMRSTSVLDHLIYPIAFLYRQNIELRLKDTIRNLRYVLEGAFRFPHGHNVEKLWSEVDKLMTRIIDEVDDGVNDFILDTDREIIKAAIKEFSQIDPDSTAFRYPMGKQGNRNLSGLKHVNVRQLAEKVACMSESLIKYETVASILLDWEIEQQSSYRENFE